MIFKKGDKVVCINKGISFNQITIGRIYEVRDASLDVVFIIDDEGELCHYFITRFRLATLLEKELAE